MKHLMIDTSTNVLVLILQKDEKEVDRVLRIGKSDHQAFIIPLIEELMKQHKWRLEDLDDIIIGVGPGSYTGLRVGVMTAKMFGYAANIKIKKVSSLLFLSSGYEEEKLVWHDARNSQGFSGGYLHGLITREEKLRHLDELSEFEKSQLLVLKEDTIKMDGSVIAKYAVDVADIFALIPNYLRKTEAEAKHDQESKP